MKRLHFAAGLFAALAYSSLYAQTVDLRANIPFDFQLGDTLMPAGEYRVQGSNGVLLMRGDGGQYKAKVFLTIPASRPDTPAKGMLQFNRYGESYFLSKIWSPDSREGRALLTSQREKEIASRAGPVQTEGITLARK